MCQPFNLVQQDQSKVRSENKEGQSGVSAGDSDNYFCDGKTVQVLMSEWNSGWPPSSHCQGPHCDALPCHPGQQGAGLDSEGLDTAQGEYKYI